MQTFTIEKTVLINAPINIVFEALTNSEQIIKYYLLNEVVSDWQVGSTIVCKGSNEGKNFTDDGIIDILIPNHQFQYSYWSDNHGTEKILDNYLTISYILAENDHGTIVNLKHSNLKSEAMYSLMIDVWDYLLNSLKNFVESQTF